MKEAKMKKRISLLLLVLLLATGVHAGAVAAMPPVAAVTLELPSQGVLPGVPYDVRLRYRNASDHVVAVGRVATLTLQPVGGVATTFADHAHVDAPDLASNESVVVLQPGEERYGYISWDAGWFYHDADYAGPGAYDVTVELSGDPKEADDGVTYAGNVRTSTARLNRIEPLGEDREVWMRLKAAASDGWPSHGFGSRATRENMGDEVIAVHPHSSYYPYAIVLNNRASDLAIVKDAVRRFHDSPAYPQLLVQAAVRAEYEATKAAQRHASRADVDTLYDLALTFGEDALRSSSPSVKRQAEIVMDLARTRKEQFSREGRQR